MSDYLELIAGNVASLLSQPAPLIIGSLTLEGYEVPSHITIGGSQAITLHKLPGGGRIIDVMGPDDGTIAWRGLFVGADAARRARALDAMRIQGTPQVLSFGDYTLNVVISHCEYDYQERGTIINYRIRTEIAPSLSSLSGEGLDINLALQDDLSSSQTVISSIAAAAATYATLVGKSDAAQITASAYNLTAIATGLGRTAISVAASASSTLASNGSVLAGLQNAGTALQSSIRSLSASSSFSSPSIDEPSITASGLAMTMAQAASLAALVQAGGYVNRARSNLVSPTAQIVAPLVVA